MHDGPIPPGQIAFLPTATGYCDALALPDAGIALRPDGQLIILGGGEGFVAKLLPEDMEALGTLLLALAEAQRAAAASAAQDALDALIAAGPPKEGG